MFYYSCVFKLKIHDIKMKTEVIKMNIKKKKELIYKEKERMNMNVFWNNFDQKKKCYSFF